MHIISFLAHTVGQTCVVLHVFSTKTDNTEASLPSKPRNFGEEHTGERKKIGERTRLTQIVCSTQRGHSARYTGQTAVNRM